MCALLSPHLQVGDSPGASSHAHTWALAPGVLFFCHDLDEYRAKLTPSTAITHTMRTMILPELLGLLKSHQRTPATNITVREMPIVTSFCVMFSFCQGGYPSWIGRFWQLGFPAPATLIVYGIANTISGIFLHIFFVKPGKQRDVHSLRENTEPKSTSLLVCGKKELEKMAEQQQSKPLYTVTVEMKHQKISPEWLTVGLATDTLAHLNLLEVCDGSFH